MNRDEFFAQVGELDEDRLRKALWTVYWRGTATMRERIEAALADDGDVPARRPAKALPDPTAVRDEIAGFVKLARAGAYMAGDRRVSPKERSRWRFTFKRLAGQAQDALRADDPKPAVAALEQLIDLACECGGYDYFRTQDAVAAAGFVVSDAVAQLWSLAWQHGGFEGFAEKAAPQLIRWESEFGWTRVGDGDVARKETSLAEVLAGMLQVPDTWERFAEKYVQALDGLAAKGRRGSKDRAGALAAWHSMLLQRLPATEGGVLDRIAGHPALSGPEQTFLVAQIAYRRGDTDTARGLIMRCLRKLPGHDDFREFAAEIGVSPPT